MHARVVATAIEELIAAGPALAPRDLSALLDLLRELKVGLGETVSPAARAILSEMNAGGKTAKLIQNLLSLQPQQDQSSLQSALRQALAARIKRAERWAIWAR